MIPIDSDIPFPESPSPSQNPVQRLSKKIRTEVQKVIIGRDQELDLLLIAVLAQGHVLIEGVPGIAKTLMARLLARTLDIDFSRIQFTPDLMPADVIGTNLLNMQTTSFNFHKGPIFSNLVLIDEVNRAPAKTQSALFEAMEEQQVTVDGATYPMERPYFVVATQNPIEQEGTYRLPEAQLDRFIFRILLYYPNLDEEKAILKRFRSEFSLDINKAITPQVNAAEVLSCQQFVEQIEISDELIDYIAQVVYRTRNHPDIYLGASPRASLGILRTAKVRAAMEGRSFVNPDDVQFVAAAVLNHRVVLQPDREMEGMQTSEVINRIVKEIEVPR